MLTGLDISSSIRNASDFVDLCALVGYYAEEHIVQTGDGYLLGLHRLAWRKGEEDQKINHGKDSTRKPVVYMHHGLMMNSEVWVCLTDEERCLPFKLVEKGYDVWVSAAEIFFAHIILTKRSLATTGATNTPKSPSITHQKTFPSGTFLWTNSPSTIFLIVSPTFLRPPRLRRFLISASLKAPRKHSQLWQSIQDSMTK